jgi:hypothetical protein
MQTHCNTHKTGPRIHGALLVFVMSLTLAAMRFEELVFECAFPP